MGYDAMSENIEKVDSQRSQRLAVNTLILFSCCSMRLLYFQSVFLPNASARVFGPNNKKICRLLTSNFPFRFLLYFLST